MDKSKVLIIGLLVLMFLGFLHSRSSQPATTTTTTKTVVVRNPPHYGYVPPPPPRYNPYKAQYYY